MKIILIAIAVLALGLLAAQLVRSNQFTQKIADLGGRLLATQLGTTSPDRTLVPIIVREFAIRNGGRVGGPSAVTMMQDAEMRLAIDQPFFRLDASQLSGTRQPGFVWQAAGAIAMIVPLRIVDFYVDGLGELEVRIAGSVPVATSSGPETAKGEAMRYLAELPWNPDAILNAPSLRWRQVDKATVEVSMLTSGGPAMVSLHFDGEGDITAIEAEDRPRAGDTPARWIGRFSDYAQVGAYRFPRYGEVAWDLAAGEFVYWRGAILSVSSSGSPGDSD
jgi:hypothetical protein